MRIIAIGAVMAVSAAARADLYGGNELYRMCAARGQEPFTACLGYVAGVHDALTAGDEILGWKACFPAQVELGQMVDVVQRFLATHPEHRQRGGGGLVARALAEAFPCR